MLSPMPWQLAGDSARWSQNWSWRPSPERGEITKVPSACTLCEGGCAIKAHLVNGNRAIFIEGNPTNPLTRGGICALGASGLQFLYAPYRIAQPMKQTKSRGDMSGFQPVSWNDALAELGKKLGKLRAEGKSHEVACITSNRPGSMDDLWLQFFTAYGSPNLFRMPSAADGLRLAAELTTGKASPFAFSLGNAEYILSFGANLFEGAGATSLMFPAMRQWTRETPVKLVQVESRCSATASKADRFLAVAPGTEAMLAMGIAHLMVSSGSYDADFVKNNVFGFEDWIDPTGKKHQGFRSLVTSAAYSPEEVAKSTGLEAAKIIEVAKEFAARPKAVAVWAIGQPDVTNGAYHQLVFTALNALKGNLKPNGLVSLTPAVPLASLPAVQKDSASESMQVRLDLAKSGPLPFRQNGLYGFLDSVSTGPKYPIEILLVHEANPSYSLAENKLFQAALAKVATLVSFSSYMDETSAQADFILPNHTAFERWDDIVGIPGASFGYYAVSAPVIKPLLDTRHTGDALLSLAAGMGGSVGASMPWKSYEEYLKFRVDGLAQAQKGAVAEKPDVPIIKLSAGEPVQPNFSNGADLWKKLKAGSCWYDTPAAIAGFDTPSGKLMLVYPSIGQRGGPGADDKYYLAHFENINPSGSESEFPLLLVTFKPSFTTGGYVPTPPFMNKLIPEYVLKDEEAFVELHPDTAAKFAFSQGERVSLITSQGEATVRINISPAAHPGVVYLPEGLGHRAYDQYIQNKGTNANSLMEVQLDPVSGMGTVWACRAQLRRV
ncbi:MAG: molybdopterin-dependent oxidoreductase [Syntrophobacteraceae bacterium]